MSGSYYYNPLVTFTPGTMPTATTLVPRHQTRDRCESRLFANMPAITQPTPPILNPYGPPIPGPSFRSPILRRTSVPGTAPVPLLRPTTISPSPAVAAATAAPRFRHTPSASSQASIHGEEAEHPGSAQGSHNPDEPNPEDHPNSDEANTRPIGTGPPGGPDDGDDRDDGLDGG